MKLYIISIDNISHLSSEESYALIESIKRVGDGCWAHPNDTTWIVHTDKSAKSIYNSLIIPENFRLIITRFNKDDYYGYAHGDVWEYIRRY